MEIYAGCEVDYDIIPAKGGRNQAEKLMMTARQRAVICGRIQTPPDCNGLVAV